MNKASPLLIEVYNSGYVSGHHHTVEGTYTDVHYSDRQTCHEDEVGELVDSLTSEEIKLGDYVLAAKYSDYDPCDPWRIGFVVRIIDAWKPHPKFPTEIRRFYIIGEETGSWEDSREYRHAKKITHEEGAEWLRAFREIEKGIYAP